MSVAEPQGVIWVCTACLFAREGDGGEPCSCGNVPWSREPDLDVSLGRGTDECGHDLDSEHDEHSEQCETRDFDTYPCAACGCHLAGTRHAYTWWSAAPTG